MSVDQQQFHCRLVLDSECMMLDDQEVTDEWMVRVQGAEYGPANIETLREWKAEGRLLPANVGRRTNINLWTTAGEIPGLFNMAPGVEPAGRPTEPPVQVSRRVLIQILAET